MLVQRCLLHDETPGTVQQRLQGQGDVHFVFSFLCKDESHFFCFLVGMTSWWLCFALLAQVALRTSVYFIPSRSRCCTGGIFFLIRVIIGREMLMYKLTFYVTRYEHQASRCCRAVDLEIWVQAFLIGVFGQLKKFSSFKCLLSVPQFIQKENSPFRLLKEQIYERV